MSLDDLPKLIYLNRMARTARIVIPHIPHHVTQRGNRRQLVFFDACDYRQYLDFLFASCKAFRVEIWAYCLMPNHIHVIAIPQTEDGLKNAFGQTHWAYTRCLNARHGWHGYLWQGRFFSTPMDPAYTLHAVR